MVTEDEQAQLDTNSVIEAIDTIAGVRAAQAEDRAVWRILWSTLGNTILLYGAVGWLAGQQLGPWGVLVLLGAIGANLFGAYWSKRG